MQKARGRSTGADFTITISEQGGVCVVDQRKLHVKKGKRQTVAFKNATRGLAHIFFPEGELFEDLKGKHQVIELATGATSSPFTVQGDRPLKRDNHYPYAVFCQDTGEFAIANSNPEIIIDF